MDLTPRQAQIVAAVAPSGRAGITTAAVAAALGDSAACVYTMLSRLTEAGVLEKGGGGRRAAPGHKAVKWRVSAKSA